MGETGIKVDVPYLKEAFSFLGGKIKETREALEGVMPKVPKYVKRKPPKNRFKKNGELSVYGERWEERKAKLGKVDEYGNPLAEVREKGFIHELVEYREPNIDSHEQVKDFLFSRGWEPQTFVYTRDKKKFDEWINSRPKDGSPQYLWDEWRGSRPKDREIPQVNREIDGEKELCPSVKALEAKMPEISYLEDYTTVTHRYNLIKGFFERMTKEETLEWRIGGFTNTLRKKHSAPLVNLPKTNKPYAESVRGSLVAREGNVLVGSDMSSLEDRVK